MKKRESELTGMNGCEGCKKSCMWNGRTSAKDSSNDSSNKFGCNSAIKPWERDAIRQTC